MERGAGKVDVLPYSEALAPDGLLRIPPSAPYNMLGFDKVHDAQTRVPIDDTRTVPLVTIPLYALLKIVAYSDRRAPRDTASVLHCLLSYEEDSERLYGVEHDGSLVDFDVAHTCLASTAVRFLIRLFQPRLVQLCSRWLTQNHRSGSKRSANIVGCRTTAGDQR
jgi:predicted nucleotidyltransferase